MRVGSIPHVRASKRTDYPSICQVLASERKYWETRSPEDWREWILCELITAKAREKAQIAHRERQYGLPDQQFRQGRPEFRTVLAKVCELKLEAARAAGCIAVRRVGVQVN
jgi:hypothetical protein